MINKLLNHLWLVVNFNKYLRFKKRVKETDGYSIRNIWWSRQTGFFCYPDMSRQDFWESRLIGKPLVSKAGFKGSNPFSPADKKIN